MKILLVVDGSSYSNMSVRMLQALRLSPLTEVKAMTVVPEHTFLEGITLGKLKGIKIKKEIQKEKAQELLRNTLQAFAGTKLKFDTVVRWGNPAEEILREVEYNAVALLVMGAKGLTDSLTFRLGSVAQTVMKHAKSSVLLVRETVATTVEDAALRPRARLSKILLAIDGSKHSESASQFLLDLTLPLDCQIIVVTALQSYVAALLRTPTLDFRTNQELLSALQAAEEAQARTMLNKIEKQFRINGYKATPLVVRGGAAESILAAAKEHHPYIFTLGSRGLSRIESFR